MQHKDLISNIMNQKISRGFWPIGMFV
jgi:hypothetical protein